MACHLKLRFNRSVNGPKLSAKFSVVRNSLVGSRNACPANLAFSWSGSARALMNIVLIVFRRQRTFGERRARNISRVFFNFIERRTWSRRRAPINLFKVDEPIGRSILGRTRTIGRPTAVNRYRIVKAYPALSVSDSRHGITWRAILARARRWIVSPIDRFEQSRPRPCNKTNEKVSDLTIGSPTSRVS